MILWLLVCLIVLAALAGGVFVHPWLFALVVVAILLALVIPRGGGPRV